MNNVPRKIYLMGFMGSGKSTVGKKLAEKLDLKFYDLDQMIESYCQCSIADLFNHLGENLFRDIETKILERTQDLSDSIISLGGGTPCFNDNINFINNNGSSIYLKLEARDLVERLNKEKDKRPLISQAKNQKELLDIIGSKLAARKQYYEMSHFIVNGNLSVSKVIDEITLLIKS